jgi:hypothetical protein
MTAGREAFTLPLVFLTVSLLGGVRTTADSLRLLPPPLAALVLAMLAIAVLVRAGALEPSRLMHAARSPLENLCGLTVLLTLYAASAQVFHILTPDTGLLHLAFGVLFFVQLLTLIAGGIDRTGALRSFVVLLGSAFVLRWILLEALYAPDGGTLKRVLTALAEGVTLGALDYAAHSPATGYTAFVAVVLYLGGLALLPAASPDRRLAARPETARRLPPPAVMAILLVAATASCERADDPAAATRAGSNSAPASAPARIDPGTRQRALRSARVWSPPAVPPGAADLSANPPGGFNPGDEVTCRFMLEPVGGTTPKFNCEGPGGETLKVKYGAANAELHAEVAATRLLSALGFGADHMFVVRRVRCAGCPRFPFQALQCHAKTPFDSACFGGGLDYSRVIDFDHAVVERRLAGRRLETVDTAGWAWFELSAIDPAAGGASIAEVDALRLMAILLAHWDNKSENQRLLCPPGADLPDGGCARPFALLQDLGATFGPAKVELRNWRSNPVWADRRSCRVSMKHLPWNGSTFPDHQISEGGRRLLLGLLEQLTDAQLTALFESSGITSFDQVSVDGRDAKAWVAAFQDKVKQIRDAGPCGE